MLYRLLALTIDQTILTPSGKITKETREAIQYAKSKGIHVTLVTGRSYAAARRVAKSLQIEEELITQHGAYIGRESDISYIRKLEEEMTFDIVTFLQNFNIQLRLADEKNAVMTKGKLPESILGKTVWQNDSRFMSGNQYVQNVGDYLAENRMSPCKIDAVFEQEREVADVKSALEGMFNEIHVIRSAPKRLEIVAQHVSKLNGLIRLSDKLGFKREQIVVIGSGLDDIPMLQWAGQGVAMGHASNEVKASANWITRSHQQNGVSYVVMEVFRKQQPIEFLERINIIQ
ncbi:hypothetical protein Q73_03420 [Bacillus coahuilensis m2-6]|uniref:Haloacid dehalogenase n=1 Tax=Bacillus coahuilensis p1.1.43 TaxID=1150625 RepID=A0A147KAX3_9BACI|nr:Cof-type HAD-IIB family hydrolase [Bacillus coahuilensis]KUP07928.1 hypothetical protein Q75_04000 [Bacillus coahuilensis p1.1.43]KUP09337.1 hypothetical protein Q73_03420 [Bacillus coahuilensis m2-6]